MSERGNDRGRKRERKNCATQKNHDRAGESDELMHGQITAVAVVAVAAVVVAARCDCNNDRSNTSC